jgi:TetR/AcrR family acrAB operon transcriptional repressor
MVLFDHISLFGHFMKTQRFSQKRLDRPNRILEAASTLITHYGYDKTTVDEIAHEAGVSKGAIYLTWPSKDDLFDALLAHEMEKLLLDLRARIEADSQGCTLTGLYTHTLLALQQNPLISALYLRDGKILGDFVHRQDAQRYTNRLMLGATAISQYQAAGLIRADLSPEVIAYLFGLLALGFMNISSVIPADQAPSLAETAMAMSALVQNGLTGAKGNSALPQEKIFQMIDLMVEQNQKEEKNE